MQHFDDPFREETLDLKKNIKKYLHLWPWFVLSLFIALLLAWVSNSYKQNIYQNHLTLLIFDEDDALLKVGESPGAGSLAISGSRLQNEIGILTSRSLVKETVSSLDFSVEYLEKTPFVDTELYPNPYFRVEIDSLWPQPVNAPFLISRNEDGSWSVTAQWEQSGLYSFSQEKNVGKASEMDLQMDVPGGHWVQEPWFRFRIVENPDLLPASDKEFVVIFRNVNSLIRQYRNITVEEKNNSSILNVSIQGTSRAKNEAFLNMHAHKFLQRELNKKNARAEKVINFIDEQLQQVTQSLYQSESTLEDFRANQQILNIDYHSQFAVSQMEQLQQKKAELLINEKYYRYLENYLQQADEDGSDLIAPSSLGVDDKLLSDLIGELMDLYGERSELIANTKRENPFLVTLDNRIHRAKRTVRESLKNILEANQIAMADTEARIEEASQKISTIPESQRNLLNIERQFQLHNTLYTFLRNKKSEMQINKAGFTPVHEVVDPALASEGYQIAPQKKTTYYMAAFAGFLLPVLLIFLYEFFNDKVRSSEDIEKMGYYPILGYIPKTRQKEDKLISFETQSLQAESFRSLRTNAQFVLPVEQKPVLMVTSTLLEEGKTFASLNMAAGYASMGKKTILLSFDLRKPRLHKYLGVEMQEGISNFLSSRIDATKIIRKSPVENMDVIYSGQIPPNPSELLSSKRVEELFTYLREHYDFIVVDTPPTGMVADSLLLLKHTNVILYIVRHNTTPVKHLQHTLKNLKEKGVNNLNIVLNDIPQLGHLNYYNAYGYQYGYFEK